MYARRMLSVVVLFFGIGVLASFGADEPKFATVVESHFNAWTKNSPNGKLTPERVNSLVNSSRIKSDEAAALAAIHLHLRGQKAPAPLDEAALLATEPAGPEERRDQQSRPINLDHVFVRFRRHLDTVPRVLFANDAPHRAGISQGRLGDCFVVSALGTLSTFHPDRLKAMIHQQPDGSCVVTFPLHQPIHVPKLTDAQIVLGSTAGDQGLWLNVMEEAVAIAHRRRGDSNVVIDGISHGGSTAATIELLTGHRAKAIHLQPATANERALADAETRRALLAVQQRKLLAGVSTPHKAQLPPGIASGHAYGVIGYDVRTHVVTVWNPWGNRFEPKGPAGLKNGYETNGGSFSVPISEFVQIFGSLYIQTAAPLPKT